MIEFSKEMYEVPENWKYSEEDYRSFIDEAKRCMETYSPFIESMMSLDISGWMGGIYEMMVKHWEEYPTFTRLFRHDIDSKTLKICEEAEELVPLDPDEYAANCRLLDKIAEETRGHE